MHIEISTFRQLSAQEIYSILKLRQDVFMLEQVSLYSDIDDLDQSAWHLQFREIDPESGERKLTGYARLRSVPDKDLFKIERVIVHADFRGKGLGAKLIEELLGYIAMNPLHKAVVLSAQTNAMDFYTRWGFVEEGEEFDDGGIPHKYMRLEL